jgi:hypothetical protein
LAWAWATVSGVSWVLEKGRAKQRVREKKTRRAKAKIWTSGEVRWSALGKEKEWGIASAKA